MDGIPIVISDCLLKSMFRNGVSNVAVQTPCCRCDFKVRAASTVAGSMVISSVGGVHCTARTRVRTFGEHGGVVNRVGPGTFCRDQLRPAIFNAVEGVDVCSVTIFLAGACMLTGGRRKGIASSDRIFGRYLGAALGFLRDRIARYRPGWGWL